MNVHIHPVMVKPMVKTFVTFLDISEFLFLRVFNSLFLDKLNKFKDIYT